MAVKLVRLICDTCGKEFDRRAAEHNRNTKKGRKTYCSYSCSSSRPENIEHIKKQPSRPENLRRNRSDEYSQFRFHLKNARWRYKAKNKPNHIVSITLLDLKNQWDKQGGICPYTGWHMQNMPSTNQCDKLPLTPDRASLDRKDSTKGYTVDNIQFISAIAQFGKNQFSEEEFIAFIIAASKHLRL